MLQQKTILSSDCMSQSSSEGQRILVTPTRDSIKQSACQVNIIHSKCIQCLDLSHNDYLKCAYCYIPVKVSETHSAEETEKDDVQDDNWVPCSEELEVEAEEESSGAANGGAVVDAGLDTSKEEDDEMEDEDMPPAADNEGDVSCKVEIRTITEMSACGAPKHLFVNV